MFKGKKVTAIVVAAGRGSRFGGSLPKQFLKMGDRTVLENALLPFEKHRAVDSIIVAASMEYMDLCRRLCSGFSKVGAGSSSGIVEGGVQRQDSVNACLKMVSNGLVLVHDGARPFVTEQVIDRVLEGAYNQGASVPCVPVKDTVRTTDCGGGRSSATLERSSLFCVQTPQCFDAHILKRAYDDAYAHGYTGTDDAGLVERLGVDIFLAEGDYGNIKITTREDLPGEVMSGEEKQKMEQQKMKQQKADRQNMDMRIGSGYDVHQLTEGRKLILGGVQIPYEKGLLGHSDADVLLHALMDALLGAAALGDIGKHFPDTDERYRGISSLRLLEEVKSLISDAGYTVGNADVTVIAQKPKIASYIPEMRKNIADTLGIEIERVNVKGTTTEKLGFVGRCEGIAAEAVCILYRQ